MTDDINMDKDRRDGAQPEPDARASDREQASAAAFGNLVDDLVAGKSIAPALEADQRELLSTAGSLRASMSEIVLDDSRRDSIIDAALSAGLGASPDTGLHIASRPKEAAKSDGPGAAVTPLHARKRGGPVFRYAPWAVAAIACAAAVSLLLTRPSPRLAHPQTAAASQPEHRLDQRHLSRPSDLLIGQIAPNQADKASSRLEIIFADRMAGYRELRLEALASAQQIPRAPIRAPIRAPKGRRGATQ